MLAGDPVPPLKHQLAAEIRALLGHTNQFVAARRLGVDQPRMSDILHDKLDFNFPPRRVSSSDAKPKRRRPG
jgi:hypothetical protein